MLLHAYAPGAYACSNISHAIVKESMLPAPCRTTPSGGEMFWRLIVRVRDGEGAEFEEVDTSCRNCRFEQRNGWTPFVEALSPYAGEPCK